MTSAVTGPYPPGDVVIDSIACGRCRHALRYHLSPSCIREGCGCETYVDPPRRGTVEHAAFLAGLECDCQPLAVKRPWRAPRDGGYHPSESMPEPTTPPAGPAGASR